MNYCPFIFKTKRWKTRSVMVGNIGVGGENPIRIQSMTTSNTRDVDATVEQIIRLADTGCEIARVTVQGMKEAEACEQIKSSLLRKGYTIPLVADIHFYPPAAMHVVDFVDKVRINPGNFVDKRASFKTIIYDDVTYQSEIQRIEEKFSPLVEKCIKLKRAMRIGTNHGSLSDRIMNRYGDTPFGMVESALEFARVCRKLDYHDFIFSMKASNPIVMIQSYRLLVAEMMKLGWDYPLHLGVTEAGEGEDGRIKSSVGTGSLLLDGIGDTIRVSLTEDPWLEVDPCKRLIAFAHQYLGKGIDSFEEKKRNIAFIEARKVVPIEDFLHRDGSVFLSVNQKQIEEKDFFASIGCKTQFGRPERALNTVDALILAEDVKELSPKLNKLQEIGMGMISRKSIPGTLPLSSLNDRLPNTPYVLLIDQERGWEKMLTNKPVVILFKPKKSRLHEGRRFFDWLKVNQVEVPTLLHFDYSVRLEDFIIQAATECGALLADKLGEGVALTAPISLTQLHSFSFNLLQACRMRTFKTDFISCPGCGRTLFDLQEVSRRIREKTSHLPGVKIAIMGCIVNGPGEMADADFGYVGSKPGKIDLYIGKTCVEKDIEFEHADERLIALIKAHGRWIEPEIPIPMHV